MKKILATAIIFIASQSVHAITFADANRVDEGVDFAQEIAELTACGLNSTEIKDYKKEVRRYNAIIYGEVIASKFEMKVQQNLKPGGAMPDSCELRLVVSGRKRELLGVMSALKTRNENLIPQRMPNKMPAMDIAGHIDSWVVTAFVNCIESDQLRKSLLQDVKGDLITFWIQRGVISDASDISESSNLLRNILNEDDWNRKTGTQKSDNCVSNLYWGGMWVQMVNELAEIEGTPQGVWLDNKLRRLK